jgi:branched-chain amino acid transport system permease protein
MATQETAAERPVARPRRSTSDWLRLVFGVLLVGGFAWWLIGKAIEEPERFVEVTLIGLTNGQVYALVALGYTLVYGIIELINFAHGDNFMLATFQTKSMVQDGSFQIPLLFGTIAIPLGTQVTVDDSTAQKIYSLTLILLLTMIFCAAINVAIERIGYKPLRNQPRLAPLITAIGFSFILQGIGLAWKGPGPQPIPDVLPQGNVIEIGDVAYSWKAFIVLLITVPVLIGLTYLVRNTRPGKAMRATAQDRDASAMMGINVDRTISFTFALGGALAGAGGVVYALYVGTSTFQLGFRLGLFAFTAAVLGGIGNLSGAVLGGIILGLVTGYNDGFGDARWTTTIVFSVLILILVFRPSGLLGERTPEGQ